MVSYFVFSNSILFLKPSHQVRNTFYGSVEYIVNCIKGGEVLLLLTRHKSIATSSRLEKEALNPRDLSQII